MFVRKVMRRVVRKLTQRVARALVLIAGRHWRSVKLVEDHFISAQSSVTTSSSLSFTKTTCNDRRAGIGYGDKMFWIAWTVEVEGTLKINDSRFGIEVDRIPWTTANEGGRGTLFTWTSFSLRFFTMSSVTGNPPLIRRSL